MATGTAGDLYVGIFGDQTALDAMFRALPPQATQTGKDTGSKFSAGFSSSFSGVSAKVGKSLGLGLADQITRGAADALKGDKTIGVAITDTIKGIPIIGAVAGLVEAGIGAAMGTYDAEKAAAQAETLAAKMKAEAGRRLDIVEDIASVEAQLAQNAATAAGNERESAKIKLDAAKKVEDVLQREIKWAREDDEKSKKEAELAIKLSELRKSLAMQAYEAEIKRIDDAKQKQLDADAEIAAKEMQAAEDAMQKQMKAEADAAEKAAEQARELAEDIAEEAAKAAKDLADDMAKEAARIAKQELKDRIEDNEAREDAKADAEADYFNIASGSANTALGAFKFEAYPPSMQKVVQERTMKAVEKLATQRAETAGVF